MLVEDQEVQRLRKELEYVKRSLRLEEQANDPKPAHVCHVKGGRCSASSYSSASRSCCEIERQAQEQQDFLKYDSDESFEAGPTEIDLGYRTSTYWNLPPNVRAAIDKAKEKNRKSEFYYRLKDLKKSIKVYRGFFKSKTPSHHSMFLKRKKQEMEKKLQSEKLRIKQEVIEANKRLVQL